MRTWTRKALLPLTLAAPLAMLSACGGGGGGGLFEAPPSTAPETVIAGAPAAIEFVSADPATLTMEGVGQAGLTQTGKVTFRVVDAQGTPVPNQSVNFTLSTEVGGTHLGASSGTTGEDGTVSASVISGSVSTPVRVIATVAGTNFSAQSVQLVVTTGVPDQDSFSLSISTFNPEAYNIDGTQVDITARLADRYNNPAPDGTQVVFTTEGGSIVGSCTTTMGACSVKWTSQNPRPADGRVTLLAYAMGEESYTEINGDGRFGPSDGFASTQDLGEAYRDDNQDGIWNPGEHFVDFNRNGSWDTGDGLFNGWLCDDTTRCSSNRSLNVFGNQLIVMAESHANITDNVGGAITLNSTATIKDTATFTITAQGIQTGQVMPMGTTIEVSTDYGTMKGDSSFTVPNTTNPNASQHSFTIEGEGAAGSGVITIKVTTPSGVISTHTIDVTETVT
ncbi:MAG: Ig-like domain-containing protein [Pseudomonadota bacterium]